VNISTPPNPTSNTTNPTNPTHPDPTKQVNLALLIDGIPERFHPKSFRSIINFNTNVWASRLPKFTPHLRGPAVGVFPAHQSVQDSWFPPNSSDVGSGGRSCRELRENARQERLSEDARGSLLVSHHCRCAEELPCGRAEAIVEDCVQRGEIPFED